MSDARKARRAAERRHAKAINKCRVEKHNCSIDQLDKSIGLRNVTPFMLKMVATFGHPPRTTREVAAAHEAGHLVVGLALGGRFVECYIERHESGEWVGYNEVFVEGVHGDPFVAAEDPRRTFLSALQTIGGIAAEHVVETYHPCSSLEEYILAGSCGKVIDRTNPTIGFAKILLTSIGCLRTNRAAFDHARTLLFEKRRLDTADAGAVRALLVSAGVAI